MANLITAQEVIELAFPENSNMREESISSTSIRIAEIKHIKPAFGNMYPMLGTTYADFTNEYIKPALAYFVKCEIISSIAIDMSNSGIAVANPQYQSAASDKQRQRLYDSEMSKAKVLLDDALAYISSHIEEFPDFVGTAPKQHYRNGGLILGGGVPARPTQVIGNPVSREEVDALTKKVNKKVDKVEGKGLSTNDYTNEERAEVAKIKGKANADYVAEAIGRVNADVERLDGRLDEVKDEITAIGNPFDDKGYYPKLTAGFADNLVGRGEATASEFTFRASAAHDNIADDTARVKRIKGNSVVWNQQVNIANAVALTPASASVTVVGNSITATSKESASAGDNVSVKIPNVVVPVGHKVLLTYEMATTALGITKCHTEGVVESYSLTSFKDITNTSKNLFLKADGVVEVGDSWVFSNIHLFDLTQMFDAGNEPSTIEEFYSRIPSGIDINAYNEGEIINLNTEAIKTVGFNQWDEQWVNGRADANVQNGLRCADYIRVIPNTTYYLNNGGYGVVNGVVRYFDKDKNFLGYQSLDYTHLFTTPQNCMYIIFFIPTDSPVTQYNNDICINLSHTGWRNGQYAPYTPFTRELAIIKKYFQNGMRSAGTAFDSIEWDSSKQKWVAVQRIGSVDLGSLTWTNDVVGDKVGFVVRNKVVNPPADFYSKVNMLCAKLTTVTQSGNTQYLNDNVIFANANGWLQAVDYRYTDAASFKSAMQGVMLYYELAEPIVTDIEEENINFDYYVEDFGTEEALSDVPSASFRADVVYTPNAVDDIRALLKRVSALETGAKAYPEVYVFSAFPAMEERGGIDISRFKELFKAVEEEKMILFKEHADGIEFFSPVFIGANVRYEEREDPDTGEAHSYDVLELYLPGDRRWRFELKDGSELSDELIYG